MPGCPSNTYSLAIGLCPAVFTNPDGDFNTLVAAWQVHQDNNYAQHVYMANLIEDMTANIGYFVSENYGYPSPTFSGTVLGYYEAVSWSGIAQIDDPTSDNPYDQIDNPLFILNYPLVNDREHIKKIYQTENANAAYSGYFPLINNNCN